MMYTRWWHISLLFAIVWVLPATAKSSHSRGGVALLAGNWKPSDLDAQPSKPFARIEGANYFCGLALLTPELGGLALQVSTWQWQQRGLAGRLNADAVKLRHLALDIKHQLISTSIICPYVTYGAGTIYGQTKAAADYTKLRHLGYAINFGAGVDFLLFQHWGIAGEYQYLYADLKEKTGLTQKYSGPKLTFKLHFFF